MSTTGKCNVGYVEHARATRAQLDIKACYDTGAGAKSEGACQIRHGHGRTASHVARVQTRSNTCGTTCRCCAGARMAEKTAPVRAGIYDECGGTLRLNDVQLRARGTEACARAVHASLHVQLDASVQKHRVCTCVLCHQRYQRPEARYNSALATNILSDKTLTPECKASIQQVKTNNGRT